MLWIVVGIVIMFLIFKLSVDNRWNPGIVTPIALTVLVIVSLIPPLYIDFGYEERKIGTTVELISFRTEYTSPESENGIYVIVNSEKVYTYRYEVEYTTNLEGTMYKIETVSGNVEEIESAECKTPTLYVYVEESKNSWWFSMHTNDRYTYVFYVPEGTIVRDVILD